VFDHVGRAYTSVHACVDRQLKYWLPVMNLDRWAVEVNYEPAVCSRNADCASDINADWRYKQATINVYVPLMAKMSEQSIEYVVVHELCHALVCQMRGKKHRMDNEEAVVTETSRAFMRTKYPDFRPQA
jgi:hypothetical protein